MIHFEEEANEYNTGEFYPLSGNEMVQTACRELPIAFQKALVDLSLQQVIKVDAKDIPLIG